MNLVTQNDIKRGNNIGNKIKVVHYKTSSNIKVDDDTITKKKYFYPIFLLIIITP